MRKERKINNKGFSLVELIIVVAIMAILAGALAPQLIKYINNSRKSKDIQTADSIALACNTALAEEAAFNAAADTTVSDIFTVANAFNTEVKALIGGNTAPQPKYAPATNDDFYIDITPVLDGAGATVGKNIAIYSEAANAGVYDPDTMLYPEVGKNYSK